MKHAEAESVGASSGSSLPEKRHHVIRVAADPGNYPVEKAKSPVVEAKCERDEELTYKADS